MDPSTDPRNRRMLLAARRRRLRDIALVALALAIVLVAFVAIH